MPTYEFRCPDGTVIEKFFKISEVPQTIPSPKGDGDAVRMITGGAGLVFKGSGFYITDYGKDGKKDQRSSPGGAGAKPKSEKSSSDATTNSDKGGDSSPKEQPAKEKPAAEKPAATTPTPPKAD